MEPRAGEAAPNGHTHEKNCLNCGASLIGPYCAACGQKAHVHRSLRGFMHDFIQGLFNFEGKIWQTLPMLARKPGEMTRRYIAGERARFVSPRGALPVHRVRDVRGAQPDRRAWHAQALAERAQAGHRRQSDRDCKARGEEDGRRSRGADVARIDRKLAKLHEDIAENQKPVSGKALVTQDLAMKRRASSSHLSRTRGTIRKSCR